MTTVKRRGSCCQSLPLCTDCHARPIRKSPPLPLNTPNRPPATLCKVLFLLSYAVQDEMVENFYTITAKKHFELLVLKSLLSNN